MKKILQNKIWVFFSILLIILSSFVLLINNSSNLANSNYKNSQNENQTVLNEQSNPDTNNSSNSFSQITSFDDMQIITKSTSLEFKIKLTVASSYQNASYEAVPWVWDVSESGSSAKYTEHTEGKIDFSDSEVDQTFDCTITGLSVNETYSIYFKDGFNGHQIMGSYRQVKLSPISIENITITSHTTKFDFHFDVVLDEGITQDYSIKVKIRESGTDEWKIYNANIDGDSTKRGQIFWGYSEQNPGATFEYEFYDQKSGDYVLNGGYGITKTLPETYIDDPYINGLVVSRSTTSVNMNFWVDWAENADVGEYEIAIRTKEEGSSDWELQGNSIKGTIKQNLNFDISSLKEDTSYEYKICDLESGASSDALPGGGGTFTTTKAEVNAPIIKDMVVTSNYESIGFNFSIDKNYSWLDLDDYELVLQMKEVGGVWVDKGEHITGNDAKEDCSINVESLHSNDLLYYRIVNLKSSDETAPLSGSFGFTKTLSYSKVLIDAITIDSNYEDADFNFSIVKSSDYDLQDYELVAQVKKLNSSDEWQDKGDHIVGNTTQDSCTIKLDSLEQNTSYQYRIVDIKGDKDTPLSGSSGSFTTLNHPDVVISSLEITPDYESVDFSFSIDKDGEGDLKDYELVLQLKEEGGDWVDKGDHITGNDVQEGCSFSVDSLNPNTVYYYQILNLKSDTPDVPIIGSEGDFSTSTYANLNVLNKVMTPDYNTAKMTFDIGKDSKTSDLPSYDLVLQYRTSSKSDWVDSDDDITGDDVQTNCELNLSDLDEGTLYEYRVIDKNSSKTNDYNAIVGSEGQFTTMSNVEPSINVIKINVLLNSADIFFNVKKVSEQYGIKDYDLLIQTQALGTDKWVDNITSDKIEGNEERSCKVTVNSLKPSTSYKFRIINLKDSEFDALSGGEGWFSTEKAPISFAQKMSFISILIFLLIIFIIFQLVVFKKLRNKKGNKF